MNVSPNLQKAIGAFKWHDVQRYLENCPPEMLLHEIELVLDVMLRDGYLILRRFDRAKSAQRETFMKEFREFAAKHGVDGIFTARKSRIDEAHHVELVYHEILSSVRDQVLYRLPPDVFLWAMLRQSELDSRDLISAMNSPQPAATFVDPVAGRVSVTFSEGEINPDEFTDSTMRTITATIKMLAYAEGWFAEDGAIEIPLPALKAVLPEDVVRMNQYLADAWSQVERSEGKCRYFGGSVTSTERLADPGKGDQITSINFAFPDADELTLHIAGERLKRMFVGFTLGLENNTDIQTKLAQPEPTPLPPDGFVSLPEAYGAIALSHVLFKWVGEVTEEYGGLKIVEWLRGYSFLQKLATAHLQESPRETYAIYTQRLLEEVLNRAGLSLEKAKVFIQNVTFGRYVADIYDAPLVRCKDGNLYLVASAAVAYNLAIVITSRLASLCCNLSWKGKTLEGDIIDLFHKNGIPAAAIKRKIDGNECEVDCVVLWEGILFVFECKNHSLPADNAQTEYWFTREQASAARQAKTKAEVLGRNPAVVGEELRVNPHWERIVPIVLNGPPYSLAGPIDGVYFYDASALHRFFEKGQIGVKIGDKFVSDKTVRFWTSERPSAVDLLRQMTNCAQVDLIGELFALVDIEFAVSKELVVSTTKVERRPPNIETTVLDRDASS
ncbi:hypothetical protein K2X85_18410 [bacterium]|nr:hypothetical protein [bacterium]